MRLFFGLSLPALSAAGVSRVLSLAQSIIPGRYTLSSNLHITLAFLGDTPQERLKDVCAVLQRCAGALPAPHVQFVSPCVFGRMENGILVLLAQENAAFSSLHEALGHALTDEGLPFSNGPFTPHVTLARHAQAHQDALDALSCGDIPSFTPECAHLYLSARDEKNVLRYTPLFSCPFKK